MTKTPQGYASNLTFAEDAAKLPAIAANASSAVSLTLAQVPVLAQSVRMKIAGTDKFAMDDGAGHIIGFGIQGTIDYSTGAVSVTVSGEVAANTLLSATYQTNVELADDLAQVQSEFASKQVKARIYALKSTIGLLQSYAMQKRFGMVAEDEAAKDLISEINAELGGDLVRVLDNASPNKANPLTWDNKAPNGVSALEHRMSFMFALSMMDKNIATTAGRGAANIYIAGATACAIMQNLPQFKLISDSTMTGPHVFGTISGKTVIRVVDPNVLDTNKVIGVYKSNSPSTKEYYEYSQAA